VARRLLVGGRYVRLTNLWRDTHLDLGARRLLVHLLCDGPHHVEFSFAAVDQPQDVADAIGHVFDAVLSSASTSPPIGWDERTLETPPLPRPEDPRVLVGSPWNIVDDDTEPITIFSA
jgi:hypothetical protein